MSWTLAADGDSVEREWQSHILPLFPRYEQFWGKHVVPLTLRTVKRDLLYVKRGIPQELQVLATTHYSVYLRLAAAAECLTAAAGLRRITGVLHLYMDLDAACTDMLSRFLRASKEVLEKYGSAAPSDLGRRLGSFGDGTLEDEYAKLINEIGAYRNATHDCVVIMVSGMVPRPDLMKREGGLDTSIYRNLAELPRLLEDESKTRRDFVDARQLARGHFDELLKILNRIWAGVIRELETVTSLPRYRADQGWESSEDRAFADRITAPRNLNQLGPWFRHDSSSSGG